MTKEINRKEIMTAAWKLVRTGKFNMSEALKKAWAMAKELVANKYVEIVGWFMRKTFGFESKEKGVVVKETEKAVYVKILGDYTWCPKSCVAKTIEARFVF